MFIRGLELGLLTDGNHQFPKPKPDEQPMEQSQLGPAEGRKLREENDALLTVNDEELTQRARK
jgi:hypothetical protein